jgi:branched-chain amino acid transport system substrate-binding protein
MAIDESKRARSANRGRERLTLCAVFLLALFAGRPAAAIKIGVMNDQAGPYSSHTGAGSVDAARMAIEDFGGSVLGSPIELVAADHQNKPDVGQVIARRWFDTENVDVIVDVPTSSVALAIQQLVRERQKLVIFSGPGASDLTGKACSPFGIAWTYDSYAISAAPVQAALQAGFKTWYFLTVDFAFGHAMERDASAAIVAGGGKVIGAARHPFNTADLSSFLLTAQNSKASIIGLANAGPDAVNSLKQAREFGITAGGQRIAAMLLSIVDVHALGLETVQGVLVTESFYWDQNEQTRAWSKRFFDRNKKMPTMLQAGLYGAVSHYLKAVASAGTGNSADVRAAMAKLPINDFMTRDGQIRADGRVLREFYVFEVKSPKDTKGPWDYYKLVETVPASRAAVPASESQCDLLRPR